MVGYLLSLLACVPVTLGQPGAILGASHGSAYIAGSNHQYKAAARVGWRPSRPQQDPSVLTIAGAVPGGAGDRERMRRIAKIKKLKDLGGDYEEFLQDGRESINSRPKKDTFDDNDDDEEVLGSKDYNDDDKDLYDQLKKQEKAALMEKVRKYKVANQPGSSSSSSTEPSAKSSSTTVDLAERFKDVETYKPQSVSWGLFERPTNIPEAFGGSQNVPLGGVKLEGDKEFDKKYEDLMAAVREYSKEAAGLQYTPEEKLREEDIQAARREARRFMLRGEYEAARDVLFPFRYICSVKSTLGATALMDLAVAYEATYEFDKAQEIYKMVETSPVADMRSKARALSLGVVVMQKLDLGARNRVNPRNVASFPYIPGMMDDSYGLYMKARGGVEVDEPKAVVVRTVREALDILEEAIISQGVGVTSDLINAAFREIHTENLAKDAGLGPMRAGVGVPGGIEALEGRWRCRITSHQESVSYTIKTDVWQKIDSSSMTVTGKLPVAPFESVRDVKADLRWNAKRSILDYGEPSGALGLFSGKPHTLRVLTLRDSVMVTARCTGSGGGPPKEAFEAMFAVWTRAA